MLDLPATAAPRCSLPRAQKRPLLVLIDFCELAVLAGKDRSHAAAFDFLLNSVVSVLNQDGTLEHLRSAAMRIAAACEHPTRVSTPKLRLLNGGGANV